MLSIISIDRYRCRGFGGSIAFTIIGCILKGTIKMNHQDAKIKKATDEHR
jgi:hypothetical protein